ncbi:MAG: NADH-quinone oxidoreductase subunit NuoN [Betaproteobacteria bacterium]|nr:NADH-quinone oxidoreductase subunit NuoN [Betaproteobacteria bacterium]
MIDQISWIAVFPEALLLIMACVIAIVDLGVAAPLRGLTYAMSVVTLLVLAAIEAGFAASGFTMYGFSNMVVSDSMSAWLKCFASLAVLVTLVYARPYAYARGMLRGGELFTLGLFALLGMFVMISGNNLLVIYLGLELLTLSSYALVALRRDLTQATEAAMKYFVLGAMASGFLLYGMSMVYGATGTLDITQIYKAIMAGHIQHQVLVFGLVFIVAGLAFKLGAVPFHMFPDVYQGAPTAVTLMIAAAPKLAAFGIVIRLLVEGLLPLALDWQQMLMVLSVASLFVGNFAAIAQTNIKRMLAYSTISQVGFILLGLLSGVVDGSAVTTANAYSSAMFYVISYVLTTLATFGVIMLLSAEGFESEEIADLSGLNRRSPLYAGVMAMCMFSLAGIPPLVGFFAKLSVLQALVLAGGGVHIGLAVFAVLMSLVGAFYYLRVVKVMYFDAPVSLAPVGAPKDVQFVLSVNALLLLLLGLLPGGLMTLCAEAILQMRGT